MTQQPAAEPSGPLPVRPPEITDQNRKWFMVLGIVLIVLGTIAILFPFLTSIAAEILIGWLFFIGGIVQVVHAFSARKWSAFLLSLVVGVLYVLAGIWLILAPLQGVVTLTLLLAVLFVVQGVLEAAMAFRVRPHQGWSWMLFSGIIGIVVGVLIFAQLPSSAVWAIGVLVGINMIFSGWAFVFLARAAGQAATPAAG